MDVLSKMQASYYCPPVGKHRNASGKLPDKIKNLKYQVKKKVAGSWATSCSESSFAPSENRVIHPARFTGNNYKLIAVLRILMKSLKIWNLNFPLSILS